MRKLLIATGNRHKFEEFRALLAGLPAELLSLGDAGIVDEVEETGATFRDNAQLKAEGYAGQSGLLTLADDSGLEIAALGGRPGVLSARYGGLRGPEQLAFVLRELEGVPFHERMARFVCVLAIAAPGLETRFVEATVPGVIEHEPKGSHGFGYDPIFYLLERGMTMAELPPEEKDRLSHRGLAVAQARPILLQLLTKSE